MTPVASTRESDFPSVEIDSSEEEEWPDLDGLVDSSRRVGSFDDTGKGERDPKTVARIAVANSSDSLEKGVSAFEKYGGKVWPKRVLQIARFTRMVPKVMEQREGNEKKIVKMVKKEREGASDAASGKTARFLAPHSRVVAVSGKQKDEAAGRKKNMSKPVKAFDVVLRASVVELARQKRAKVRLEICRRKRRIKWERNIKMDGLGEKAEVDRMENLCFKEEDFNVGLKEVNVNKRKKKCDFSSMSSKPSPCVVCWTAEGLETLTGREVSCVNMCLSVLPTQNRDSRFGDPKREAGRGLRERFGDPRQLEAGGGESETTSSGAEATDKDFKENVFEESVRGDTGLRPAPSLVVGGDVGSESPQKEGVATSGVALQAPNKEHCAEQVKLIRIRVINLCH